ncbi:MAG TPA: response regulator [Polyangia bacterium]|nr:response regulator [Polyangia bacterium]
MPTVLIVEGYRDLMDPLAEQLRRQNWQVVGAGSVTEAVRLAENDRVDVVLADERLSEGSGLALEDAFKLNDRLRSTPIVYMTALASPSVGRTLAGRRILAKPFTLDRALEVLESAVDQ